MKRPESHVLEDESKNALRMLLPSNWIIEELPKDYGIDWEVRIVVGEEVTNKVLWVQIKATESINCDQETVTYRIETKHLKDYEKQLLPLLIVYWIKSENTFYYLFAQKYIWETLSKDKPNWREQNSVTIKFDSKLEKENIKDLESLATDGYLYIIQKQLNIEPGKAYYWLDGIPKSDNEELKERTLKALKYLMNEEYSAAIKEFETTLKVCTISPIERMSLLLNLGSAYYSTSQYDKALENYNAVLESSKNVSEEDALEGKAAVLGNIGLIYRDKSELDAALTYLKSALKIYREIGNRQGEAAGLGNMGIVYREKDDLDTALKHHQDSLKINREFGDRRGEAAQLCNIGIVYSSKGDLDTALKYLQEALKIDQYLGERRGEAENLGNIGFILGDMGKLDDSLRYHQEALRLHKEIGYRRGEADQLGAIGTVYSLKGDQDTAIEYLKNALEIHREIGNRQGEASDLGNIGIAYKYKGDRNTALKYLKESLEMINRFNLVHGQEIFQNAIDSITSSSIREALGCCQCGRGFREDEQIYGIFLQGDDSFPIGLICKDCIENYKKTMQKGLRIKKIGLNE